MHDGILLSINKLPVLIDVPEYQQVILGVAVFAVFAVHVLFDPTEPAAPAVAVLACCKMQ